MKSLRKDILPKPIRLTFSKKKASKRSTRQSWLTSAPAAKAYKANVLEKESLEEVHKAVLADFGPCDILINGAGGNNPRATTANEYYFPGDIDKDIANFFNLDKDGVGFVFNLNFLGTLIPTQVFAQDMVDREGCNILNVSSMNAYTPLTKIPTAPPPPVPAKSWRQPPWTASANLKNWSAR